MKPETLKISKKLNSLTAALLLCLCGGASAATLTESTLAQQPMSSKQYVPPAIIITLDNSSSMNMYYNELNYNKDLTYTPPPKPDGSLGVDFPVNENFLLANREVVYQKEDGSFGLYHNNGKVLPDILKGPFYKRQAADMYFEMLKLGKTKRSEVGMKTAAEKWLRDTYGISMTNKLMSDPQQLQNFANWSAYYRVRMWAAKAALGQFLVSVDPDATREDNPTEPRFLIGYTPFHNAFKFHLALNPDKYVCQQDIAVYGKIRDLDSCGVPERNAGLTDVYLNTEQPKYVEPAPFDNAQMKKILVEAYRTGPGAQTPIQEVALDVANKFKAMPETSTCRQYFHIMISDGGFFGLSQTGYGTGASIERDLPVLAYNKVGDLDHKECSAGEDGCWAPKEYGMWDKVGVGNTFADVALHQYMNDLRPDLANNVPPAINPPDPPDSSMPSDYQGRQRLITYTVGIGIETGSDSAAGNLKRGSEYEGDLCGKPDAYSDTYDTDTEGYFADVKAGKQSWGSPMDSVCYTGPRADLNIFGGCQQRMCSNMNDFWHAAVNGRGRYFQTMDASGLVSALLEAFSDIEAKTRTSTGEAMSSTVTEGSIIFEPSYTSGTWEGSLKAYRYSDTGAFSGIPLWKAEDVIPEHGDRKIFTTPPREDDDDDFEKAKAIPFTYKDLNDRKNGYCEDDDDDDDDNGALCGKNKEHTIDYLRGDQTYEAGGEKNGGFRKRVNRLGDIVNASPLYVTAGTHQGYSNWNDGYEEFFRNKLTRKGMVYAGANDGMLHAFDASNGVEKYAYIPRSSYKNLVQLSSPAYGHKYFVDGTLSQGDAFIKNVSLSSAVESKQHWRSVLLVTLGAGGKGLMAFDITNPDQLGISWLNNYNVIFDNTFATGMEVPDKDENKLGFIMGEAHVVNIPKDEEEAKIVPNPANAQTLGYSRADEMGEWYALFGNGYASKDGQAALGLRPLKKEASTTYITAGSSGNKNGLSEPTVIYDNYARATGAYAGDLDGNLWYFDLIKKTSTKILETGKPITTRPIYREHPRGGHMIAVGTGKFIETTDGTMNGDNATEALYAVWYDKDNPESLQGSIKTRSISGGSVEGVTDPEYNIGVTSKYRGWKLDLTNKAGTGEHERVVANPVLQDNMFIVKTFSPTHDQGECSTVTGDSWLYALDINTGGTTEALNGKDRVKLNEGGTSGIALVTKGGKAYIRTKSFSGAGTDGTQQTLTIKSPGYRTWHKLPTHGTE